MFTWKAVALKDKVALLLSGFQSVLMFSLLIHEAKLCHYQGFRCKIQNKHKVASDLIERKQVNVEKCFSKRSRWLEMFDALEGN